jgi:chemotaxis protein methyltransferase CheR
LVGPSEPNLAYFSSFRAVNAPGVTLYQKPDASPPCEETAVTLKPLPPLPASPRMDISETTISMTEAQAGENMSPSLIDVRRHADQGEWGSALQCCEQLLKKDNLNAKAHFYQALVLYQMKRYSEAEQSLRRALYLDRRFVLAHYYLGLFLQSRGDSRLAARSFENALELMSSLPDEEVFAEGDGINVAELKELVKLNLDVLPERK